MRPPSRRGGTPAPSPRIVHGFRAARTRASRASRPRAPPPRLGEGPLPRPARQAETGEQPAAHPRHRVGPLGRPGARERPHADLVDVLLLGLHRAHRRPAPRSGPRGGAGRRPRPAPPPGTRRARPSPRSAPRPPRGLRSGQATPDCAGTAYGTVHLAEEAIELSAAPPRAPSCETIESAAVHE